VAEKTPRAIAECECRIGGHHQHGCAVASVVWNQDHLRIRGGDAQQRDEPRRSRKIGVNDGQPCRAISQERACLGRGRIESGACLNEHLGAKCAGPRRRCVVITDHEHWPRRLDDDLNHSGRESTREVLALHGFERLGESLLRAVKSLDGDHDGHPDRHAHSVRRACRPTLGRMGTRVCVVGAGSWGTTVAALAAENGEVVMWARRRELADEISTAHTNRAYTGARVLPTSLRASCDLAESLDSASVVAMAVPSGGFRAVAAQVAAFVSPGVPVVSLSKGLDVDTGRRMSEVIVDEFPDSPVAVLSGPNLALEILAGQPAAGVMACADDAMARLLASSFARPAFRLYTNPDVIGCEIGGVVKNVIAIAAGIVQGFGFGDNTKAALITRGLAEMSRLGCAVGARPETFAGLAGVGDLVATCASSHSRNSQVGVRLGRGESLASIVDSTSMVAEGVRSSGAVVALAKRVGVEMPICEQVAAVCDGTTTAAESLLELMSRSTKGEFD